ncbi:MAG: serine hydrolase [Candidatus Korobacteraceae bacterium]
MARIRGRVVSAHKKKNAHGIVRRTLWISTILLLISAPALTAQQASIKRLDGSTISSSEVDATVTRLMNAAEVPGVGIAIFNDGKIAYLKTYGLRDEEKNLPLTPDSVMTAASLTKAAFATVVMELVEQGVLDLDKPVYQYLPKPLPEYPAYADLAGDPRYKLITLRMCLDHTTGFPNLRAFTGDHKLNINFQPGSRFAYSGEGILLAQLVVETVTRKPINELMRERLFLPDNMTRTSMVWEERFESDYANGYDEYGRSLGPERWKRADAAGSMQTTLRDYASFLQALLQGRNPDTKTREQMLTPQVEILEKHEFPSLNTETTTENKVIRLSYGLGWGLYFTPYGRAFFKEGHDEGWRHYAVCFDKSGTGILIMTNSSNGEGIYKPLLETLLHDSYTPIEWEGFTPYDQLPPRPPLKQLKEITLDPKLLDKYVGRYRFSPEVVLAITREGNTLFVQENDEPKQELGAEGERQFFSETADDEYSFELDSSGRVTTMVLHTDGKDLPMQRIEDTAAPAHVK